MRKITLVFLFLLMPLIAQAKSTEQSFFQYGKIPFGKTIEEVQKTIKFDGLFVDGSIWSRVDSGPIKRALPYTGDVPNNLLDKYFKKAVFDYDRFDSSLIKLFFLKDYNDDKKYSLCVLFKELKGIDEKYQELYDKLANKISKDLNMQPTKYKRSFTSMNDTFNQLIGSWSGSARTRNLIVTEVYLGYENKNVILYRQNRCSSEFKDSISKEENKRINSLNNKINDVKF